MSVGMMLDRKDRPAYIRFERRAIEDRDASQREGRYVARDVDYVLVTPPYSRDVFEQVAADWFAQMKREVGGGRLPQDWYDRYVQAYEHWRRGEEPPLHGTPIRGWSMLSPAQQKNLISLNILTVEDLAAVNDEGKRRMGMGAQDLCDKARAWLSQTADKGPLTIEVANLRSENRALKAQNEQLDARVKELAQQFEILQRGGLLRSQHMEQEPQTDEISADDIMDDAPAAPPVVKRGPGRPRKNSVIGN